MCLVLAPVLLSLYEVVELLVVFVVAFVGRVHLGEFRERGGELDLIAEG